MKAAGDGDLHTIQELASSGVEVTGSLDRVSMCVAIQYTHTVYYLMILCTLSECGIFSNEIEC